MVLDFNPLQISNIYQPQIPTSSDPNNYYELWNYFCHELSWGNTIHARATFDFLINAKKFSVGNTILDAGAGHQRYRKFFDDAIYLSQEHPDGINFKKMQSLEYDLISPIDEKIPLIDNCIKTIITTSVLEHVRHPEKFLCEAHRVLHPCGRIYIHVPFTYHEHETPYDFQRPTRFALKSWLKISGFNKIFIIPSSNSFYGASNFILKYMHKEFLERNKSQQYNDLAPILNYIISTGNSITDDYIDITSDLPIGWIAIAEKDGLEDPMYKFSCKSDFLAATRIQNT